MRRPGDRLRRALPWVALPMVVAGFYLPVLDGDFVFDDRKIVVENDELWEGLGFDPRILEDRSADPVRTNYRPMRFLSYKVDVLLSRWLRSAPPEGEADPFFFHLQNILIHALNSLFVGLILRRMWPAIGPWIPLAGALAFGLHPIQSESVAYISGRRDVLFAFFYLAALLVYLVRRGRGRWGSGLLLAGLYALGLLSKEMAVSLPLAIVAVELIAPRQGASRPLPPLRLLLPVLVAGGVVAALILGFQNPGGGVGRWGGSASATIWSACRVSVFYLRLLLWPAPLSVDYSYNAFPPSAGALSPITGLLSLVTIGALLALGVVAWRRGNRPLAVGIPLFFLTLLPVLQVFPHPERVAERFLYLPSLAFLLAAAGASRPVARAAPVVAGAGAALILTVWGALLHERLRDWEGPYPLWKSAVEASGECARARFGLGNAAMELGRPREATASFSRAIELLETLERTPLQQGYYLQALSLRASLLASSDVEGDLRQALADLTALVEETDTTGVPVGENAAVLAELMKLHERLSERPQAIAVAERLRDLPVESALRLEAALYIAAVLAEEGKEEEAWRALESAGRLAGSARQRARVEFERGLHLQRRERWREAQDAFERAALLMGRSGRWVSARYLQAECRVRLGDTSGALVLLREVIEIDGEHLPALISLGELSLGAGDLDESERCFRRVLAREPREVRALQGLRHVAIRRELAAAGSFEALDPSELTVLLLLAERKVEEGDLVRALEALRRAEGFAEGPGELPRRLAIRLQIARLEVRRGELRRAAEAYRSYLEIAEPAARADGALEAAEVRRRLAGPGAALELLEAQWRAGVRDPRLTKNLGGLAARAGTRAAAVRWY
ncbi:MAG: tetratricopeptide repeat protein, partial [Planctomycetota bacterium]